jgi:hypothetical protein
VSDDLTGVPWSSGTWLNPPVAADEQPDGSLTVTAARGSDFWRTTSYGFVHDDGHALLAPLPPESAVEVDVLLDLDQTFDQAGVMVRVDERTWVKAAVEHSDGQLWVGAVVTREVSDWSVAPVPHWHGRVATIRVSRSGDALTVRARPLGGSWQLVRVAPLAPDADAMAGPLACAPTRDGLRVRFERWATGPADAALHEHDDADDHDDTDEAGA